MSVKKSNTEQSTLFQKILWGRKYGAFDDPLGQQLMRLWQFGVHDDLVAQLIQDKLRPIEKQAAMGELPPFARADLAAGQMLLGQGLSHEPIRLIIHWLVAGLLLASNTGGGKSNLLCFLSSQLAALGIPVWLSESYKRQLRRLRPLFAKLGHNLIILRPQDWRWNLLQSHLREVRTHLILAVDLLARSLDLPPRARSILMQGCHALYEQFGIWQGQRDRWPTLFDLFEWVRKTPGLNMQAQQAILDRLGALLLSLGSAAAYRQAWNPAQLAAYFIVFEMSGLSEMAKRLLLESLILTIFLQELEKGIVNGPLKLVIAFDDAQRMFDVANQASGMDLTPMDELAGIIRGTGISLWVIVQTLYGLSPRLIPNLANKLCGRLGSADDYYRFGAMVGLTPEQNDWVKLNLGPGMFVGQVAEGDYRSPFVFKVPLLKLPPSAEDWEAAESVKALDHLPTMFADEFSNWHPHPVASADHSEPATGAKLGDVELRFLKLVVDHSGKPASFYAKAARLNGQKAAQIRQKLVAGGFVREHILSMNSRGRSAVVLEPLDPAFQAVAQNQTEETP